MDGPEFLKTFDMHFDPKSGALVRGGEMDRMRDAMVRERWTQLYAVGWDTVTLVNCLTWPLEMHASYGYFKIPCPDRKKGEIVHTYEIRVPSMDMRDLGECRYVPEVIMPVEIAREFERKYKEEGGVFWYKGDVQPADFAERLKVAHDRMSAWFEHKFMVAQANWSRYNKNPFFIDDRMRDAGRFLYERKRIPEMPEWVAVTRDEAHTSECPACSEIVRKGAKICKHCGFTIDADFARLNADRLGSPKTPHATPEPEVKPRKATS